MDHPSIGKCGEVLSEDLFDCLPVHIESGTPAQAQKVAPVHLVARETACFDMLPTCLAAHIVRLKLLFLSLGEKRKNGASGE